MPVVTPAAGGKPPGTVHKASLDTGTGEQAVREIEEWMTCAGPRSRSRQGRLIAVLREQHGALPGRGSCVGGP